MQEGYLFPQAISMLLPHHIEAHEDIQQQIDEKLRQGVGVAGIFETLQLGNHYLMAIKVAENNGHMIEAFKGVAKQITVSEKTKKVNQFADLSCHTDYLFIVIIFVFRTFFAEH